MWLKYILKNIKLKFDAVSSLNREHLINSLPVVILGLVVLIISYVNYTLGTYLSGWDTLHPEFDLWLNLKRVFFGVWREEQGLGAIAIHSHMSELPRLIFLFLTSLIFPVPFLRYFFFFAMLLIGVLGVYYYLKNLVFEKHKPFAKKLAAFGGGLFYLLNLGTLQHFYVPFEMFAVHYALLPWVLLMGSKFLFSGERKHFLIFILLIFLSSPIAYAATLWYVFFAALVIYFVSLAILSSNFFSLRRTVLLIFATLIINSYWLLPQLYFANTSPGQVSTSKINQMFSLEASQRDEKYANLGNAALLRGFLFSWQEFQDNEFTDLLDEWKEHGGNPLVFGVGWVLFGGVLFGIFRSFRERNRYVLAILPMFLFSFVFLIYTYPPISNLFSFLREQSGLFREAYRFPWTKFSLVVIFCYSLYFAQSLLWLMNVLKPKIFERGIVVSSNLLLIIWMLPAFSGHFIGPTMRVDIPSEYFDAYRWFSNQPKSSRIAQLPVHSFWGWQYNSWGFQGAGFIWFGLNQSMLVRDFDRWSPYNENYYWEISYAIYSKNVRLLENVLEKYQVNWLLADESIINPSSAKSVYLDEIYSLLLQSNKVEQVEKFGFLKVYKVNLDTPVKDFVYVLDNPPVVEPTYKWGNYDGGYEGVGGSGGLPAGRQGYISSSAQSLVPSAYREAASFTYYPFRSLFTGKRQEDLEFEVEDKGDYYAFSRALNGGFGGVGGWGYVEVPEFSPSELQWINPNDFADFRNLTREIFFDGERVEVKIPKVGGYLGTEILPELSLDGKDPENCNRTTGGQVENQIISGFTQSFVRLTALDATNCSALFSLPSLPHNLGYLITVESRNIEGRPLLFWLENLNSRRADIETYLPKDGDVKTSYFVQPPMEEDGLGYTLHFDTISIGREKSINDLGRISINPVPHKFLSGIVLRDPSASPLTLSSGPKGSGQVEGGEGVGGRKILVLSQAYHKGWTAFVWDGLLPKKISEHVLVNNWANGWILNPSANSGQVGGSGGIEGIKIIFLPQLLEYTGFLLAGGFVFLVIKRKI